MSATHTKIAVAANAPESFRMLLRAQLDAARVAGFDVHCVAGPGAYLQELARDGYATHEVPLTRLFRPGDDLRALWALVRLFRRERFALVHTHTPKTALLGQLAARIARVPHVVNTVHGLLGHADVPLPRRAALAAIDRMTCLLSTAILSQSREDVDAAIAQGLCRAKKIRHLGQGIDLARFDPARVLAGGRAAVRAALGLPVDGLVIATVGRFTREKGYPELLSVARQIARERADVHFLAVGMSLPERDAVRVDPAADGLAGRLTVLVDRHDMPEIYATADLVVLPTHREGFPRSLVEAGAMGIPIVATQIRGCREAVTHGLTGLLVAPGNPEALYDAVMSLVGDRTRRMRMGEVAQRRARIEFDETRICERVIDLYCDLLAATELPAPHGRVPARAYGDER